jgi:hypothetical protein
MRFLKARTLLSALAVICCCISFASGHASAATSDGPDQNDFGISGRYGSSNAADRTVDYTVATSAYNTILTNSLIIYLPTPTGTVVVHDPNICYGTFRNGGRNYDQIDDGTGANWGNAVSFKIGASTQWGYFDNSGTCDNPTLTFNLSGASLDLDTNLYQYTLTVTANAAGDKYMDTYWITAPAGSYISQDSSQPTSAFGLNETSPIPGGDNPTNTQSMPDPYKNYWNGTIRFAPDCSVTTPTVSKRIEIYDDDNHNNWDVQPMPFLLKLEEYNRAGTYQRDVPPTITLPDGGGTWSQSGGWYDVFGGGNNKRIWLDYTLNKDMVYQWKVDSVFYDNTLQFKIPFDSVFYYRPCQTGNFNLNPNINASINGGAVAGNVAEVGDQVTFTYAVNNTGSTGSVPATCEIFGKTYTGYTAVPSPNDTTSDAGYVPPGTGCPRTFPTGNTTLGSGETITASTGNRTLCRSLRINPATPAGPSSITEVCVLVTSKPYMRVYGGDVSAGNGFSTGTGSTCTTNVEGAVVSWNKESAGSYAGAGAQFATFAMDQIYDFATALGNSGGANAGSGLAFGNKTPSGGMYGGSFGGLPCINDYYYDAPTTTPIAGSSIDIGNAATVTGPYGKNPGPLTAAGVMTTAKRVSIFVNGDVIINNNITYPASWTSASPPLVYIVAKGNIYIGSNVTQLDGVYVAQRTGASGGVIYTCASGSTPVATNALATSCGNKLTVNGSFVAYQVQFLRASGSQAQSAAAETPATTKAAEVFNYGPSAWMAYPPNQASTTDYDAITSLPPIL